MRNDRPLAKDLPESRLFTLETVPGWKYAPQSAIHLCCNPHREILHHQHWDYSQTALLLHSSGWCVNPQAQTCGFTAAGHSVTHRWCFNQRKLLVTFYHGFGLLAGGLRALHYRLILHKRIYPPAAGEQVTHITCRPLINQTRASSRQRPSAVQPLLVR